MIKGSQSQVRLDTVHRDLKTVVLAVALKRDIIVICGHRGEKAQNEAFERGASGKRWPDGKHNTFPSDAVDIAPYPWNPNDIPSFEKLRVEMFKEAALCGVPIRWGGDWDRDGVRERKENDLVHYERITRSTE